MRPVVVPYGSFRGHPSPFVKIGVNGTRDEWRTVAAYVDSGASFSIFSTEVSEQLGLRLKDGRVRGVTVGDGVTIPVYVHRLNVQIGPYRFLANIGFSERLRVGFNLLGREDFFQRFDVTFSDTSRRLTFQPVKGNGKAIGRNALAVMKLHRRRKAH